MREGVRRSVTSGRVDLLVAGSGLAGLAAAHEACARGARVMIVTAGRCGDGASRHAQGGMAIPCDSDDMASHVADTLEAGRGLCDAAAVRSIIGEAPNALSWLEGLGVRFDAGCAREGGHSRSRVRHRDGDRTGAHIMDAVGGSLARHSSRLQIVAGHRVIALCSDGQKVTGALLKGNARPFVLGAGAVIMATGGLGRLYARSSNPAGAFGEGVAIGVLAGAVARDMEFVQFHPTITPDGTLLTEALRGAGARLINATGEYFMSRYEPDLRDLAPRDVVARAVRCESTARGRVFLDIGCVQSLKQRFPSLSKYIARASAVGDMRFVPVTPAAHYGIGGLKTDLDGRTTLDGLYAAGEVASTGLHGANRLASNSMLEAVIMGRRAARAALSDLRTVPEAGRAVPVHAISPEEVAWLPRAMERHAGLSRSGMMLRNLEERLFSLETHPDQHPSHGGDSKSAHQVLVARLIVRGALLRTESCGVHWRDDAPTSGKSPAYHLEISCDSDGRDHRAGDTLVHKVCACNQG